MIPRLMMGVLLLAVAACTPPVAEASAAEAAAPWACRDVVRGAAVEAYALARFRDDQRAVILLPAGKAAAGYEPETRLLSDEGVRLLGLLKANAEPETLPPPFPVSPSAMTDKKVATGIAAADACVANAA